MVPCISCWVTYAMQVAPDTDIDVLSLLGLSDTSSAAKYFTPGFQFVMAAGWVVCSLISLSVTCCARDKGQRSRRGGWFVSPRVIKGIMKKNERAQSESFRNTALGEGIKERRRARCVACTATARVTLPVHALACQPATHHADVWGAAGSDLGEAWVRASTCWRRTRK